MAAVYGDGDALSHPGRAGALVVLNRSDVELEQQHVAVVNGEIMPTARVLVGIELVALASEGTENEATID